MSLRDFGKQKFSAKKATSKNVSVYKKASNFTVNFARNGGPGTLPPMTFTISPAVSGKTTWDLLADGPLDLSTAGTWTITPTMNFSANVIMWGAAGGSISYGPTNTAGAGGSSNGFISFVSGTGYSFIVGGGGQGGTANRNGGGGGAGSGIDFSSNSTSIMVAGGGGGGYGAAPYAGAGGGTSGETCPNNGDCNGGGGGTQSAAGNGGTGARRTGIGGSGRNGGGGAGGTAPQGSVWFTGGTGYGQGGYGSQNTLDAGSGGGGGGYFGGGGGGGNLGGNGGGGGSGYIHPTIVTGGTTTAGTNGTTANVNDPKRGSAGNPVNGGSAGNPGKIYMSYS